MAKRMKDVPERLAPWGQFEVLRRVDGGHRNLAFLVRSGDGALQVAKTTTRSEPALAWAFRLQQEAGRAGIIVPAFIAAPDGRLAPGGLTLEPYAEGRAALPDDLGRLRPGLALLRSRTRDWPQRPGFTSASELLDARIGGDVDLAAMPAAVASACLAAWKPLVGRRQVPIHGDLNSSNLLIDPEGRPILLDWDEARRDSPLFDMAPFFPGLPVLARARLAWEVASGWRAEPTYARALAKSLIAERGGKAR